MIKTRYKYQENMSGKVITRTLTDHCPDYALEIKDAYPSGAIGYIHNPKMNKSVFLTTRDSDHPAKNCVSGRELLVRSVNDKHDFLDDDLYYPRSWDDLIMTLKKLLY